MLNQSYGFVNEVLLGGAQIPWLTDPLLAKVAVLGVNLWLGFPYMFLICTGALQSLPADVLEAAQIDGAGRWRTWRSITLPLLLVATAPLLIASFAFNFNNFTLIYMLTGGGPRFADASVAARAHRHPHLDGLLGLRARRAAAKDYGLASALSIVIFVIVGDHLRPRASGAPARSRRSPDGTTTVPATRPPGPRAVPSRRRRRRRAGAARSAGGTSSASLADASARLPARLRRVRVAGRRRHAHRLERAVRVGVAAPTTRPLGGTRFWTWMRNTLVSRRRPASAPCSWAPRRPTPSRGSGSAAPEAAHRPAGDPDVPADARVRRDLPAAARARERRARRSA